MNTDAAGNSCISHGNNLSRAMAFLVFAIVGLTQTAVAQTCEPHWDPDFGQPGLGSTVFAMAAFDDGSGPGLYAGVPAFRSMSTGKLRYKNSRSPPAFTSGAVLNAN